MMDGRLWTITEAAVALGTDRATVRGLIRAHGLAPKPVPRTGAARGLDARDLAILARALGYPDAGRSATARPPEHSSRAPDY